MKTTKSMPSVFKNIKLFSIFFFAKRVFIFYILENKKLFSKSITKQGLRFKFSVHIPFLAFLAT